MIKGDVWVGDAAVTGYRPRNAASVFEKMTLEAIRPHRPQGLLVASGQVNRVLYAIECDGYVLLSETAIKIVNQLNRSLLCQLSHFSRLLQCDDQPTVRIPRR